MSQCYNCSNVLDEKFDFTRSDRCTKCGRDTRCCINCTFFDPSKYNECTEPVADRVVEKDKSNFCDFFKPSSRSVKASDPAQSAKSAAELLFKKK